MTEGVGVARLAAACLRLVGTGVGEVGMANPSIELHERSEAFPCLTIILEHKF